MQTMIEQHNAVELPLFDNLDTMTNRRGQVVTFTYDFAGRVKTKSYPAANGLPAYSASFDYDARGNLEHAADNYSDISTTYDDLDRAGKTGTVGLLNNPR